MNTDIRIEGLDELCAAFAALGEGATAKLSEPATTAAEIVLARARSKIHNISGDLSAGLKIVKPSKKLSASYKVIAKVSFGKGAAYGVPLELGHRLVFMGHKTLKDVPAHPFLRPAADESKQEVADIMTDAMNKILEEMGGGE